MAPPELAGTLQLCQEPSRHCKSRQFKARAQQRPSANLGADTSTFTAVPALSPQLRGSVRQPPCIPQHKWRQNWSNSCWEQGHAASSKLDRLFLIPSSLRTSYACCPPQEQPAAHVSACVCSWGQRGWTAREGRWQGTPIRLGDPPGAEGEEDRGTTCFSCLSKRRGAFRELFQCCQKLTRAKAPSSLPTSSAPGRAQHRPPHKALPVR